MARPRTGTAKQRPDGTWSAVVTDPSGVRTQTRDRFETKEQAIKFAMVVQGKLDAQRESSPEAGTFAATAVIDGGETAGASGASRGKVGEKEVV